MVTGASMATYNSGSPGAEGTCSRGGRVASGKEGDLKDGGDLRGVRASLRQDLKEEEGDREEREAYDALRVASIEWPAWDRRNSSAGAPFLNTSLSNLRHSAS